MLVESVPFIKIWRSSKSLWKIEVNDKLNLIAKHVEIHFFHNLWTFRKIPWVFSLLCPMWTMDINYKTSVEIVYPNLKGCVLCEWCTLKLFSRGSWFLGGGRAWALWDIYHPMGKKLLLYDGAEESHACGWHSIIHAAEMHFYFVQEIFKNLKADFIIRTVLKAFMWRPVCTY